MSSRGQSAALRGQTMWMLVAAALFGYAGFRFSWAHRYTLDNELLIMVALLMWSLRGGSIAFVLSALLSLAGFREGLLVYGLAGVITSVAFVAVAIWDWASPQYFSGIDPLLLLILAAFNGYMSIVQLRDWTMLRGASHVRNSAPGQQAS